MPYGYLRSLGSFTLFISLIQRRCAWRTSFCYTTVYLCPYEKIIVCGDRMMDQMRNNESTGDGQVKVSDLLERLGRFDEDPSQFLVNLLAVKCFLGKADEGAILCGDGDGRVDVIAVHPQVEIKSAAPTWLMKTAELVQEVHAKKTIVIKPLDQSTADGQPAKKHVVMIPLKMVEINNAIAVFLIESDDEAVLEARSQRLQLVVSMLL